MGWSTVVGEEPSSRERARGRAGGLSKLRSFGIRLTLTWVGVGGMLCAGPLARADTDLPSPPPVSVARAAFDGTWLAVHPTSRILTPEGKIPPLKPAAAAVYRHRLAARKAGDTSFDRATWCASPGIPRFMIMPYPFEIAVTPRRVAFMYFWSNWYRLVDMGRTLTAADASSEGVPASMGISSGRWDGDTLVVESVGIRPETMLDGAGLPHSETLKLTERVRLLDKDTLEDRFTIDDPVDYVHAWETVMTYRRQPPDSAKEHICLDHIKHGEPAVEGD